MNLTLVAVVWVLVTLDCSLMGYRLAMGRSAVLDKRRYYQRAAVRGGLLGLLPLFVVTTIAVVLVNRGGPSTATEFNNAMGRFIVVGGTYAAIILAASALCALPSVTIRTAASVIVFGPLTLLRPLVVVLTIGLAIGSSPTTQLVAVGLLVAIPGVAIEPLIDHRIAKAISA
jgi:hypothetical protein